MTPSCSISRDPRALDCVSNVYKVDWQEHGPKEHGPQGLSKLYEESVSAEPESSFVISSTGGIQHSQAVVPIEWESILGHDQFGLIGTRDQSNDTLTGRVGDKPVHNETSQPQKPRASGTVIPCPLEQQNGCSGRDENMASLE
jgi:hypothetical protein